MPQSYMFLPKTTTSMGEEWLAIGLQHSVAGRHNDALAAYSEGLRVAPDCATLVNNIGTTFGILGNMAEAVQQLERGTLLDEKHSTIWQNYAFALLDIGRPDEALTAINKAEALDPSAGILCAKGMILTSCGKAAEAVEAYDAALEKDPKHEMASYNTIFARTLKNTKPEEGATARRRWHEIFAYTGEKAPHTNDKTPDRPLRVGYVGGDFKMHSAAFIFSGVILKHDRKAVEPYCYMSMTPNPDADPVSKQYMEQTSFRIIEGKDDATAAAMIREDKIDVLVDLAGHTGGNRLKLFTYKPAPIQCHAWGFAHGTGCPEVDYFLADPYAVPEAERKHYVEQIWDLPAIVCYDPPQYNQLGISEAPMMCGKPFTFGVFGRFEKLSPQSLEAWHKILLRVPGSRIQFKDSSMRRPFVIRYIRSVMKGIDPKRILFMQESGHSPNMLSYQTVDLVLDTFPHSGGVTALEILYMGVPIVTLYNGQPGGRTTSVALRVIGRQGWIANTINEYVDKAVQLATNGRAELAAARPKLRQELLDSPLCGDKYCRAVEDAYRQMWWRYCGHKQADEAAA